MAGRFGVQLRGFRVRFGLRWLLVLVAVAAVWLGLFERRRRFLQLKTYHEQKALSSGWTIGRRYLYMGGLPGPDPTANNPDWHWEMAHKYERAARYPWLSLPPDPDPAAVLLKGCIEFRMQGGETLEQARKSCCSPDPPFPRRGSSPWISTMK